MAKRFFLVAFSVSLALNVISEDVCGQHPLTPKTIDSLKKVIVDMGQEDQQLRKLMNSFDKSQNINPSLAPNPLFQDFMNPLTKVEVIQLTSEKDVDHSKKLSSIIDIYGWPTTSSFGHEVVEYSFVILQHSNLEMQKKYLPLLTAVVKKGEAPPFHAAMMHDRILVKEGKEQIFGTQLNSFHSNSKKPSFKLYPIYDEINVEKRRAEIGLGPLDEYLKLYGIERVK